MCFCVPVFFFFFLVPGYTELIELVRSVNKFYMQCVCYFFLYSWSVNVAIGFDRAA